MDVVTHNKLERFRVTLTDAIRRHYSEMIEKYPDVYGYVIYSVTGLQVIDLEGNRESTISVEQSDDDYDYYRLFANEWNLHENFGDLTVMQAAFSELQHNGFIETGELHDSVVKVMIDVLCQLETEGLFGAKTDERFLGLMIFDTGEEEMLRASELLNTKATHESFAALF